MNILKKIYCRIFQTCFRIALPVLPYREPELIDGFKHVPEVLKKHHISHILLVTDPGDLICMVRSLEERKNPGLKI